MTDFYWIFHRNKYTFSILFAVILIYFQIPRHSANRFKRFISLFFVKLCIFAFLAGLFNCAGNTVFNAALMLALPNENRSAILGFIRSASVGGTALSAVIYGFIGELFPLYIIFALGSAISLIPMIYLCFNKNTRDFMIKHSSAEI